MAATTKIFKDDSISTANDLVDVDANGFKNENNDLITASGQSLDTADNFQTANAVRYMAQRSASFDASTPGGGTIQLDPYSGMQAPTQYYDGQIVLFKSPVTSDGVTLFFLKIGTLPTHRLLEVNGDEVHDGDLITDQFAKARFSKADLTFYIIKRKNRNFALFSPSMDTVVGGPDTPIVFDTIDEDKGNMMLSGGNVVINQSGLYRVKLMFNSNALATDAPPPPTNTEFELTLKLVRNPSGGAVVVQTDIFKLDAGITHPDADWNYTLRPPLFTSLIVQATIGDEFQYNATVISSLPYQINSSRTGCSLFMEYMKGL